MKVTTPAKVPTLVLLLGLLSLSACAIVQENVTHGPGLVQYPGYRIEYVDATPKPGTALQEGSRVTFTVKVRYTLQERPKDDVALLFRDQSGDRVLRGSAVSSEIKAGTGTITLSQEVTIPEHLWGLWLYVPVIPEGVRDPTGELRIRYSVVGQKR